MGGRMIAPQVQLVALALWLGAAAFFSFALAPALFATLPSRTLAGAVVGRTLPIVFFSGIAVGSLVVALQAAGGRAAVRDVNAICGCLMVAACGVAQFVIGRRIDQLRREIGGPLDALSADDARRVQFGRLHGLSVAWLGLAMLAAGVALVFAWRAQSSHSSSH
jgi:hypothetical protein